MSVSIIFNSVWNNPGNGGQRLRRLGRAGQWQIWKHLVIRRRIIRLANGTLFAAYPDSVVSSALIYSDWPEYWELKFIRQRLRPEEVVIDVGANVGHICLLLSDIVGPENLIAFEPTPVTFRRLTENWRLNGWPIKELYQCAVGASEGKVDVPDTASPNSTNAVNSHAAGPTIKVPLVALDDFRKCWSKQRIGLLKIDVEGYEPEVFRGVRLLLHDQRPRIIMFESLGGTVDPIINSILQEERYTIFQLDSSGRPQFDACSAQNLFAMPNEELTAIN